MNNSDKVETWVKAEVCKEMLIDRKAKIIRHVINTGKMPEEIRELKTELEMSKREVMFYQDEEHFSMCEKLAEKADTMLSRYGIK